MNANIYISRHAKEESRAAFQRTPSCDFKTFFEPLFKGKYFVTETHMKCIEEDKRVFSPALRWPLGVFECKHLLWFQTQKWLKSSHHFFLKRTILLKQFFKIQFYSFSMESLTYFFLKRISLAFALPKSFTKTIK